MDFSFRKRQELILFNLFSFLFKETDERWKWMKPPPASRKPVHTGNPENSIVRIRRAQKLSVREKLLKGLLPSELCFCLVPERLVFSFDTFKAIEFVSLLYICFFCY